MDSLSLFNLKGKTALITGSSGGIGMALAEGLAGAGARIILNGRNEEKLKNACAELSAAGIDATYLTFDVSQSEEVKTAINRYEAEKGPIDILVNNAGINLRGRFEDLDEFQWKKVLDININGAMIVSQVLAPYMIKRRTGKIINICSMQSELGRPTIVPYAVSKGGIKMLTRALCAEWAQFNIQVNGIGPGYFSTDMTKPLKDDPDFDRWLCSRTPSKRWGDTKELIGAAVFLASEASNYVNGHILYVDGGLLAVI